MALEEIRKLSNIELAQSLVEAADCRMHSNGYFHVNVEGSVVLHINGVCASLDAIAEIEKSVIEKVGHEIYSKYLHEVLFLLPPVKARYVSHIAEMSARQKAEALLLALQNKG